ncbi:C-terminal binding protein [Kocuria nitroreducens]|uniref:C-terminal binding protein n=1 Tax=Kocuria nitroreducens TaxID=3058914 RepID=UPI0036D80B83
MSKRIVITDHEFKSLEEIEQIISETDAVLEVNNVTDKLSVLEVTRGADVVLIDYAPVDRDVAEGLAPGAVVIRAGIGYDNIDVSALRELGVRACNVPDYGASTVADHTVMLALAVHRKVREQHQAITKSEDGWAQAIDFGPLLDMADATYGLVGSGQIARLVAKRVQAFGATVIAADPYVDPAAMDELGIELVSRDELVQRADMISLHAPLTPETRHIIGYAQLASMKPGVTLVNTSRGPLLDTVAAAEALHAGKLGGLGLDVFETEPLEPSHPIRNAPRTLLTPHSAFYSERSQRNMQRYAAEEAVRACRGEALRCEVGL